MSGRRPARPLRSWLFAPAARRRFLEKVYELAVPPDAVLFDLEDGVPPAEKEAARAAVVEVLRARRPGPLRAVRVNGPGTPWFAEDLRAIVGPGLEGICVPKVQDADDLGEVIELLERSDPAGEIVIVPVIESAGGLLAAAEIARAHRRVAAVMFGAEDFAADLGLPAEREGEAAELTYARSAVVVAAAAARVIALDGVFPDLDDRERLLREACRARRLGFAGKAAIHPDQLEIINGQFTPTAAELEHARRVMEAFERATGRGEAAVALDGRLIDPPIVERARALLAAAGQLERKPREDAGHEPAEVRPEDRSDSPADG